MTLPPSFDRVGGAYVRGGMICLGLLAQLACDNAPVSRTDAATDTLQPCLPVIGRWHVEVLAGPAVGGLVSPPQTFDVTVEAAPAGGLRTNLGTPPLKPCPGTDAVPPAVSTITMPDVCSLDIQVHATWCEGGQQVLELQHLILDTHREADGTVAGRFAYLVGPKDTVGGTLPYQVRVTPASSP